MRVLLDTNILARQSQPDHALHSPTVQALERLHSDGNELRVVPQVLYEYWAVATRPVSERGLGLTIEQASLRVAGFRQLFPLLRDERRVYEASEQLVQANRVHGKTSHDARLVAAMQRHGLTHILTFNRADFERHPGITVLEPQRVVSV
jgi:predicted nucleic acid-binding protein